MLNMKKTIPQLMLFVLLCPGVFFTQTQDVAFASGEPGNTTQQRPLRGLTVDAAGKAMGEDTVAAGLKHALAIAVERSVELRGAEGGFGANAGFRIEPPAQLCRRVMRSDDADAQLHYQRLQQRINYVAEQASVAAEPLLQQAVEELEMPYAIEILRAEGCGATDYLESRKKAQLQEEFPHVVRSEMAEAALYYDLCALLESFVPDQKSGKQLYNELHTLITTQALEGLFVSLRHEEHAMRSNPSARPTPEIKRVFSR